MTGHSVYEAVRAHNEDLSRLAWRTALYQRMDHRRFPKTENALFAKTGPTGRLRQTLQQQYAMAKLITKVMH